MGETSGQSGGPAHSVGRALGVLIFGFGVTAGLLIVLVGTGVVERSA